MLQSAEVRNSERWRLTDLYADEGRFAAAKQELERQVPQLGRWRDRLCESAASLAEALDEISEARRRFLRLRSYAGLKADEDIRIATDQARRQEVDLLGIAFGETVSYLRPEILALAPEKIERFIGEEPALEPHAFFLRDLLG